VGQDEILARFVFSPLHVHKKSGAIKPSLFSHVISKGCSVQRDSIADTQEMLAFILQFLESDERHSWSGVVFGNAQAVRAIATTEPPGRAVCIFDTALKNNTAHAELCQSQYVIDAADQGELRHKLMVAFGEGRVTPSDRYRNGTVWEGIPDRLKVRS
jgi:hypothetical protein